MRLTILGLAAFALSACQSAPEPPPAPAPVPSPPAAGAAALGPSVTIIPPDTKVPRKYAAFSGIWTGRWDGAFEGKLAVRTVAANGRAEVTYAWGTIGDNKPGVAGGKGRIAGNTLKLERLANGADSSYTLQPDGTLMGTYTLSEMSYSGVFSRQ